jgi:hypothetical protein
VLVLDGLLVLSLAHPIVAGADPTTLRLGGFSHATWDWDGYANRTPHLETFDPCHIESVR